MPAASHSDQLSGDLPRSEEPVHPNEAGVIPILEYHNITSDTKIGTYDYPATELRKDLEWLYVHNYRPINLSDYVRGWIDCPAGMSPVVITFDDAVVGQFRYLQDGTIDPNCAVGILDAMNIEHSDWKSKATFFVLTNEDPKLPPPFCVPEVKDDLSQRPFAAKKMAYLVQDGFEIGNHTLHHSLKMRSMSLQQVQAEFAGGQNGIHKYLPGYNVDTLALPYGIFPLDKQLVQSGESNGVKYHNICALAAGSSPAPSPMSRTFQPYRVPRIIPGNEKVKPGGTYTIRFWLNELEEHPYEKFISDGDPNTYTVPPSKRHSLDITRLTNDHYTLRVGPEPVTR
jgi:peptidoglycan/xylan/chitin deacetylase (PgdA/CDA1 family)